MAQAIAGASAPFIGLQALATLRGVKRWIVPPTVATVTLLIGALYGLWHTIADATADDGERVDLDFPGWLAWLEWAFEWVANQDYARAGGVLLFLVVAFLAWWFLYAIVFEVLAGPFLSRMQARAEDHWLGGHGETVEHPFETRGLMLLTAALGLGGVAAWFAPNGYGLVAFAAPLVVLWASLPAFRAWFGPFVRLEGRAAIQGGVVALVALVGSLPFLLLHFLPGVGSLLAAGAAGFFLAIGTLDLALERRGWSLDGRFALARHCALALVAFGAVCAFLFALPVIGPLIMLPSASLGGTWLVSKLDKSAVVDAR